jgi:hypothetical protein
MFATGWGRYRVANNLTDGGADHSAIDNHYDDLKGKVKGGWRENEKTRKPLLQNELRRFFGP